MTGTTGAYTRVFEEMEAKLREIKEILDSASISNDELVGVQSDIDKISGVLAETTARLNDLDSDLVSISPMFYSKLLHTQILKAQK